MVYRKRRDCGTHTKWEYKNGTLEIFFEFGHFHFGDGEEIRVVNRGKEVLLAYDDSLKRQKYPQRDSVEVGGRMN